ncbi:hypothetical protein [Kineosporia sp. R_H_3]|uniref:hypothetical protein n=1 Tax=Kineosporia sp. R_H_3 TaxID=1961848 RepID=UPI000B4BB6CF|nr:hypothetical protein [Kineosporia sp. R_H_3]
MSIAGPRPRTGLDVPAVPAAVTCCESCGWRPAIGRVALDGAEPFSVCADCAPAGPHSTQPTGGAADGAPAPAAAHDAQSQGIATDPHWQGTVIQQTRPRDLAWTATVCGAPPLAALTAYTLTAAPAPMVTAGLCTLAAVVWLDHRRPRRLG